MGAAALDGKTGKREAVMDGKMGKRAAARDVEIFLMSFLGAVILV